MLDVLFLRNTVAPPDAEKLPPLPQWSFFVLGLAGLVFLAGGIVVVASRTATVERRAYWAGFLGAGAIAALAVSPQGWQGVALIFGFVLFATVVNAYVRTPYLVVAGRIWSFKEYEQPEREADADPPVNRTVPADGGYGDVSAAKFWWIITMFTVGAAVPVYLHDWRWQPMAGVTFACLCLTFAGRADARNGYSIVRRQWLPAAVIVAVSVVMFGVPVLVYLLGYGLGLLFPADAESEA